MTDSDQDPFGSRVNELTEAYAAGHYYGALGVINRLRMIDPEHPLVKKGERMLPLHPYHKLAHTLDLDSIPPHFGLNILNLDDEGEEPPIPITWPK